MTLAGYSPFELIPVPGLHFQAGDPYNSAALSPLASPSELMRYPAYREAFAKAFGSGHITFDIVAKAIARFERTLVSGNSPFDRYY